MIVKERCNLKVYMTTLLVSLVICFVIILSNDLYAHSPEKNDQESSPDFQNVDVVIIYKHNGEEYLDNVDVFDKTKSKIPYLLITIKELGRSEILILEGLNVFIYDHDTGGLLKIYHSSEYNTE